MGVRGGVDEKNRWTDACRSSAVRSAIQCCFWDGEPEIASPHIAWNSSKAWVQPVPSFWFCGSSMTARGLLADGRQFSIAYAYAGGDVRHVRIVFD